MYQKEPITVEMLIWAYTNGVFPMADSRRGTVQWYSADPRAILPLDALRISRSLARRVRRDEFDIRFDTAFEHVVRSCAHPRRYEGETWINDQIIDGYTRMHRAGLAHSVEAWLAGGQAEAQSRRTEQGGLAARSGSGGLITDDRGYALVGGLYGVALGGAFFGESMFSRATDASKVCLVHLVEHLRRRGYGLLDVQMNSRHMARLGAIDVSRDAYLQLLAEALNAQVEWGEPTVESKNA